MSNSKATAIIKRASKNAMQSGRGTSQKWILEYIENSTRSREPLMGWTSSSDMRSQIKLKFTSLEEAENYANANNISYKIKGNKNSSTSSLGKYVKTYADNFKYGKFCRWTH